MTRKDIPFLSSALRDVRASFRPSDTAAMFVCDAHAKQLATKLQNEVGQSFDKNRFLRDAGVQL